MSRDSEPLLRALTEGDIPDVVQLSTDAGWNQTDDDWRLLIQLAPEGCIAIEVAGELASTATLLLYGRQLAWIGMVLTKQSFQGRGFARRLLTEACRIADQLGVETIKLDATDQGKPLYEKLGFRFEQNVERWERVAPIPGTQLQPASGAPLSSNTLTADSLAFGVDRSELLARLAQRNPPHTLDASYVLTRRGRLKQYLGPCIAATPSIARTLIEHALESSSAGGWCWDLLPENTSAVTVARYLMFEPKRHLERMVRGKDLRGEERSLYALAGFEYG